MATKIRVPRLQLPVRLPRRAALPAPAGGAPSPGPVDDGQGAVMGFFDHLEELRQHLFRAVLGLAGGMVIALLFAGNVIDYMTVTARNSNIGLQSIAPTETIGVFFRVTLMMAAIFASPWITYQLLSFITPGLTSNEKRALWRAIPVTTLLFLFGVVFTWLVLMPAYTGWLAGFKSDVIKPIWTAENYFAFVTQVLFWHGAAFESPVVFFVLARIGLITANQMIKYWRHAIVGAAFFAGFIAPTYDPLTMILITVLLFGLYLGSIGLVIIGVPGSYTRQSKTPKVA